MIDRIKRWLSSGNGREATVVTADATHFGKTAENDTPAERSPPNAATVVSNSSEPVATVTTEDLDRRVADIHAHIDEAVQEVRVPVLARLDEHEAELDKQLQQLPTELKKCTTDLLQQLQHVLPVVPGRTKEVLETLGGLGEGHRRVVNVFLQSASPDDLLSYNELAERLRISPVTVRVYVGDLRRLGFPFREQRVGKKLLIGVEAEMLRRILAASQG